MDKKPATTINAINTLASPSPIVGLGVFHTQAAAEAAMKRMYVCGKEDAPQRLIGSHTRVRPSHVGQPSKPVAPLSLELPA